MHEYFAARGAHDAVESPVSSAPETPEKTKRAYRPRGTCGTFAGNRPPKRIANMEEYNARLESYKIKLKQQQAEASEKIKKRTWQTFVKEKMPLESDGTALDKLRNVALQWAKERASQSVSSDTIAQENRAVV